MLGGACCGSIWSVSASPSSMSLGLWIGWGLSDRMFMVCSNMSVDGKAQPNFILGGSLQ